MYLLGVQGHAITQGEWGPFITFWVLWTLSPVFGFTWIKRSILKTGNNEAWNWAIVVWWVATMWVQWIAMFLFWRQANSESDIYQAGMWMYMLCAWCCAPFPYLLARGYRVTAIVFGVLILATGLSTMIIAIDMNDANPGGYLSMAFFVSMLLMFLFALFIPCNCSSGATADMEPVASSDENS